MRIRDGICVALIAAALATLCAPAAGAVDLATARRTAIVWLENHQNTDGSWGSGPLQPLATAESLYALSKANRSQAYAARRAVAWLRAQEYASLDFRARAIRAMAAAGANVSTEIAQLRTLLQGSSGVGLVSAEGVTAYDSALVLSAIAETLPAAPPPEAGPLKATILARLRGDAGWSGDDVPLDAGASDRSVSAEIIRALAPPALAPPATIPAELILPFFFIGSGGGTVTSQTPTLEVAARLAAEHLFKVQDLSLQTELLQPARIGPEGVWSSDPYINAMGLLAVTTTPSVSFDGGATADDDGDGTQNKDDAFPQDPLEHADLDHDGIGDARDPDRDGDGACDPNETAPAAVCTGVDAFPDDPNEVADTDGDLVGSSADLDDDGDNLPDVLELAQGTDPRKKDTDGDGVNDDLDTACPLVFGGVDQDGDGVCWPVDRCDNDPTDWSDLDGDGICDLADGDDDEDGFSDAEELVYGSDPRDQASRPPTPAALAASDPNGDFDRDGLTNLFEAQYVHPSGRHLSPFLADTDSDGATDAYEVQLGFDPTSPSAPQPKAVVAVFSSMSPSPDEATTPARPWYEDSGFRMTLTGGQATPVSREGDTAGPSHGAGVTNLAGFQPMATILRDLDGDGLNGLAENARRTSPFELDSDHDGFVDGAGNVVLLSRLPAGMNLDANTAFVDGEADFSTDPSNPNDHPGRLGDVAPFGHPDGRITSGDAVVALRIAADPLLPDTLPSQAARDLCRVAFETVLDGHASAGDAARIFQWAASQTPAPARTLSCAADQLCQ